MTGFSRQEYERRWGDVLKLLPDYEIDVLCVTADLHVRYLAGTDSYGYWAAPLILAPGLPPTYVVRRFDEDRVRREGAIEDVVSYFGEDEAVPLWAASLRSLGFAHARVGLELDCWGLAPVDVALLGKLLPDMTVVDVSRLVPSVMEVKSPEEIASMRRAMELTRVGIETFYASLREGCVESEVGLECTRAMVEAGSERPEPFEVLFGERTAVPHGAPGGKRLERGDVAFTELSGTFLGYCAALARTAVLGPNRPVEGLHEVAQAALEAGLNALRPGVTTGAVDAACRAAVERAGRGDGFRHRAGYSHGLGWFGRGDLSLKPGGADLIRPGMVLHLPIILFERGAFGVACSETVLVTEDGAEPLSGLPRDLVVID